MSSFLRALTHVATSAVTQTKCSQQSATAGLDFKAEEFTGATEAEILQLLTMAKSIHLPGIVIERFLSRGSLGCTYLAHLENKPHSIVVVKILSQDRVEGVKKDMAIVSRLGYALTVFNQSAAKSLDNFTGNVVAETDYIREAMFHGQFHTLFKDQKIVRIPAIYPRLSSDSHLVSELLQMVPLHSVDIDSLDTKVVQRIGDTLVRFCGRSFHGGHMVYGDLSPGNVLLGHDGSIGIVDFGCCESLTTEEYVAIKELSDAANGTFLDYLEATNKYHSSTNIDELTRLYEWTRRQGVPYSAEHSGEFELDWYMTLTDDIPYQALLATKLHRKTPLVLRTMYGLTSILTRIGYRGDAFAITQEEVMRGREKWGIQKKPVSTPADSGGSITRDPWVSLDEM
jgi:serine/threonine protein kinase